MSIRESLDVAAVRAAIAACAVAFGFAAWAFVGALRPIGALDGEPAPRARVALPVVRPVPPPVSVELAVDEDVFAPSRTAPAVAFRMPGEADGASTDATAPAKPTVLGTAVGAPGYSFAMTQLGGPPTRIVHVGDNVGQYTVRAIARGHVVFATAGGEQLDISAETATTQEPAHASLDTVESPFIGRTRAGGAFFGAGTRGPRQRGRRTAPDSVPFGPAR